MVTTLDLFSCNPSSVLWSLDKVPHCRSTVLTAFELILPCSSFQGFLFCFKYSQTRGFSDSKFEWCRWWLTPSSGASCRGQDSRCLSCLQTSRALRHRPRKLQMFQGLWYNARQQYRQPVWPKPRPWLGCGRLSVLCWVWRYSHLLACSVK